MHVHITDLTPDQYRARLGGLGNRTLTNSPVKNGPLEAIGALVVLNPLAFGLVDGIRGSEEVLAALRAAACQTMLPPPKQ